MIEAVTDPGDRRVDDFRWLNDVAHRRAVEPDLGIFIGEGLTVVDRMLAVPGMVRAVLTLPERLDRLDPPDDVPVYTVERPVLAAVVGFDLHRGVVASGYRPVPPTMEVALSASSVAVFEGINDHENLGAMLRTAAALGVGAVVVDPTCADPWYRRSVRVSMGGVLAVPVVRATSWPTPIGELRGAGFEVLGLDPGEGAVDLASVPTSARRQVLVLGAEGPGLTDVAKRSVERLVRIPMASGLDSLNVGHAFAIAAYRRLVDARPQVEVEAF